MVARLVKLTADQQRRLRAAHKTAREKTSARIALNVVPVSDKYPLYPIVFGAVAGTAALGGLAIFWPDLALRHAFYATAGVTLAVTALLDAWMALRLSLIPKGAKIWECWEMAHRSFAARILARNDRVTGILIFVSLGEHYVEVVTDRDVDLHIPQKAWDGLIREFSAAAKGKRLGEGLIRLVEGAADVLAPHYPVK